MRLTKQSGIVDGAAKLLNKAKNTGLYKNMTTGEKVAIGGVGGILGIHALTSGYDKPKPPLSSQTGGLASKKLGGL